MVGAGGGGAPRPCANAHTHEKELRARHSLTERGAARTSSITILACSESHGACEDSRISLDLIEEWLPGCKAHTRYAHGKHKWDEWDWQGKWALPGSPHISSLDCSSLSAVETKMHQQPANQEAQQGLACVCRECIMHSLCTHTCGGAATPRGNAAWSRAQDLQRASLGSSGRAPQSPGGAGEAVAACGA